MTKNEGIPKPMFLRSSKVVCSEEKGLSCFRGKTDKISIFMERCRVFAVVKLSDVKTEMFKEHFELFQDFDEFAKYNYLRYLTQNFFYKEKLILEVIALAENFGFAKSDLFFYYPKKDAPLFVVPFGDLKGEYCFCLAPVNPQKSKYRFITKEEANKVEHLEQIIKLMERV